MFWLVLAVGVVATVVAVRHMLAHVTCERCKARYPISCFPAGSYDVCIACIHDAKKQKPECPMCGDLTPGIYSIKGENVDYELCAEHAKEWVLVYFSGKG